jgi:hypothetical protein
MYPFLVFVHVASAFICKLAHGATAAVLFQLPKRRLPER